MSSALYKLNALADLHKAEKHPSVPYLIRSKYSDRGTSGLTRCIVDYLTLSGYFTTRLQSYGAYQEDRRKYVSSQQRTRIPNVLAVVGGRTVFVEVKVGKDCLSDVQKQRIAAIQNSGAYLYVARTFQGFYDWFETYILASPKLPTSLYCQRHPIPYLATPDLPKSTFIP